MTETVILAGAATALEAKAGASTTANPNQHGYWKRIAEALEILSGTTSSANSHQFGYMLRAATAVETISGTSGSEENRNEAGLLKRIVDGLEVLAGATGTGSLMNRLSTAIPLAQFFGIRAGNLVTNPDALDNASWTKSATTVTADQETGPWGTQTMDLVIPSIASAAHFLYSAAFAINGSRTVEFFVKPAGYDLVGFREAETTGAYATFNTTGPVFIESGNAGGYTVTNPSITALPNGIFRIRLTLTGVGNANVGIYILSPSYTTGNPNDLGWAGDGVSGMNVGRVQAY